VVVHANKVANRVVLLGALEVNSTDWTASTSGSGFETCAHLTTVASVTFTQLPKSRNIRWLQPSSPQCKIVELEK
jgi:hypothetical protein